MTFEFPVLDHNAHSLPFFIRELGYLENQDHVYRNETYINNQLLICTSGSGKLIVGNKEHFITNQNIFLIKKNVSHEYYAIDEPWGISWIVFDGTYVNQLFEQLSYSDYEVFKLSSTKGISNLFDEALSYLKSSSSTKHIDCSVLIYTILTKLSHHDRVNNFNLIKSKKEKNYIQILQYIESHYNEDISLDVLCEEFKLSKFYICRLFKDYNNNNLISYLTKYKLSLAKKNLLLNQTKPIWQIAKESGFRTSSYFCSKFKKSEGMTPIEFRQHHGIY